VKITVNRIKIGANMSNLSNKLRVWLLRIRAKIMLRQHVSAVIDRLMLGSAKAWLMSVP
jgi:hypothetical protein